MDWMRTNPLVALMGLVAVVLAVAIGLEIAFATNLKTALEEREGRRGVPADAKLLPALANIGAEQAYPETVARPLFIPTRRPAPEAPAVAQGALQRGQYVLQGTIVVGDNRVAMVREKSTGKVIRIERGKDFNGMKVVSIDKEAVTLGVGNDEEKLMLNVIKPPASPVAAAPQGGPFPSATPAPAAGIGPAGGIPVPGQPGVKADPNAPGTKSGPAAKFGTEAAPAAAPPLTPEEVARRRAARRQGQQQGN
ncbi:MAG TPA: hypothetical protein VKR38_08140 [Usitatibacter sp.]|nr:hypothetical protein [Usitatibacter sp.]